MSSTLLLKNALVIATMDDEQREIANGSVFIRGNRVEAVGPASELPSTADKVIDMTGHVLIPGLINTHHHMFQSLTRALPAAQDAELFDWLTQNCNWSVAHVGVEEIDRLNIYHASHLAMCRAVAGLKQRPDHVLVDGNKLPRDLGLPAEAIVQGDARSVTIAAASILAKVLRDRIMVDLAQHYPGYGWEVNAGYPTPAHKKALLDLGVTPHHRRSFKPVHNILCKSPLPSN